MVGLSLALALVAPNAPVARAGSTCFGAPITIIGSEGPDTIEGTSRPDVIDGEGGDDARGESEAGVGVEPPPEELEVVTRHEDRAHDDEGHQPEADPGHTGD